MSEKMIKKPNPLNKYLIIQVIVNQIVCEQIVLYDNVS